MSIVERGFSDQEFEIRTSRLQAIMELQGLGAVLLTTEPDIRYFSGFLTQFWQSPTRPWFLVVPAVGKPIAVIPGIGADLMAKTWIEDIRTWQSPDLNDDGVSLLADTISMVKGVGAGTRPAKIGLPMGHESHLRMPLGDFERLKGRLSGVEFIDATPALRGLQMIKSDAEIAKITHSCAIAGRAFDRVAEIAAVGIPLSSVFRNFQRLLLEEGADCVPYLAGGAGPGGYGDVISPATDAPLNGGDLLMLDTGSVFDGYFCDFDRNFALGRPDNRTQDAQRILYEATEAGLAAAKPGALAADLFRAMHDVLNGFGGGVVDGGSVGRYGHGLGMRLTEWPSLIPGDRTMLESGMVLTLEPCLEIGPGRMMVHEEDIVIRDNGALMLSPRCAADLPVLE